MVSALASHHPLQHRGCFRGFDGANNRRCRWRRTTMSTRSSPEESKNPPKVQYGTPSSVKEASGANVLTTTNSTATCVTAPFVNALKDSAQQNVACFRFPGHVKGNAAPTRMTQLIGAAPFLHDLPELSEADDLFSPKGVILDAQKQASLLFGSSETWFLVGGSTCGIQASIMATCSPEEALILPRNSHISAISAMVLSGVTPKYILPEYNQQWDIAAGITPSQVEGAIKDLEKDGKKAGAVLVVSPTYHGICSNLYEIAKVCHFHGIPLVVDEAHGGHFKFNPRFPSSALEQGADLAVQSTHKLLGSLSQSSMLHMSGSIVDKEKISRCLQMLQSSSPSYLLLASLDAARAQLSDNPYSTFDKALGLAIEASNDIKGIPGISLMSVPSFISGFPAIDPLRITIGVWQLNMTGYEVDDFLTEKHNIIAELAGSGHVTFPIHLGTSNEDIERLVSGLRDLSATYFQETRVPTMTDSLLTPFEDAESKISPREAFFAKKRRVNISDSIGEICGEIICPYPPGVPVLVPGEVITETALSYLLDVNKKGGVISGASDHELSSVLVCSL